MHVSVDAVQVLLAPERVPAPDRTKAPLCTGGSKVEVVPLSASEVEVLFVPLVDLRLLYIAA